MRVPSVYEWWFIAPFVDLRGWEHIARHWAQSRSQSKAENLAVDDAVASSEKAGPPRSEEKE